MVKRDFGIEFENWIRHTLPWQLNLSASKEVATNIKFGGFADYVRQIAFCETLLGRLSDGKRPTQDDLFMWDSVVKMSYESKALADRLNSIR